MSATCPSFPAPESSRPRTRLTPGEHRLLLDVHERDTVRMTAAPAFDVADAETIRSMPAATPSEP